MEMAETKLRLGDQDMGVEGIGASVVRKEDRRFITGKGRYVDDIKLMGMTHAHFIRSPHAHAKVKGIDSSAAMTKSTISIPAAPASMLRIKRSCPGTSMNPRSPL